MSSGTPVKLRIPRQDMQGFDFFDLSAEAAQAWALALPVTSSTQVARQLAAVIGRLNRIEIAPELRYSIMEKLRSALLVATANLTRRFLKQPLVMSAESQELAELAGSLYDLAATAYTISAVHAIQRRDSIREVNPARLACEALHRALRFTGAILLKTFQLYRPLEPHRWLTLHQLYALAERQKLSQLSVEDELTGSGTVATAYLQALMLGCSKPNQLRQNELGAIYRGLQEWAALVHIRTGEAGDSLFLVDLDSDHPPLYTRLYRAAPGPRIRYIDTGPLVAHLEKLARQGRGQGVVFDKDTVVRPALLEHLISCFSKISMRNFTRRETSKSMWVVLGLSASHFYLAGEQTFGQLLHGENYIPPPAERLKGNPFLEQPENAGDAWQRANPEEDFSGESYTGADESLTHEVRLDTATMAALEADADAEFPDLERYLAHSVTVLDASPGGYCLEWTADLPADARTGELACVRENNNEGWSLAAIRWVSRPDDTRTLIGLELLSPSAKPYGARVQQQIKGEKPEPLRVLLLPEIKLVGQPPTIITPRAGFREKQKIVLLRHDEEFYVQLTRQMAVTGAFVQFEFRHIKQLGEVLAEDKSRPRDTVFDSLWTNI